MNRHRQVLFLAPLLAAAILSGGCAAGNALTVQGDLGRPEAGAPGEGATARAVAVADFAYEGPAGGEIGRDFVGVKPIVWKASPARQAPDLLARILFEKGIPVIRVRSGEASPPEAAARIWGRIDELLVTARRAGAVQVEVTARVSLTVYGSASDPSRPYTTTVSSDYSATDPLFVTSERVLEALNGAANGAAEEAVRRLIAAGVIPAPRPQEAAPGGPPAR